jgi:ABC-type amino acid transport substrate-binding protein
MTIKHFIAAIVFVAVSITGASIQAQPLPQDIAQISKSNKLVVSMTKFDTPPFYSGSGNDIVGIDADIARAVANMLGVTVVFRRDAETFQEVVEQVRRGEADLALSKLSITPPRLQTIRFTVPYAKLHQALLVNRLWLSKNENGRSTPDVIRNLNGSIGFIKGTAYETFARINFPNADFVPKLNWNEVLDDVMTNKTAVAYRDELEIKKLAIDHPESSITTKAVILVDSTDYIAGVVDYRNTQLLAVVDFVIQDKFQNIKVQDLIDRYKAQQKGVKK